METCKLTRHGCNYAPFNPTSEECHTCAEREEMCSIMCGLCDKNLVDINSSYPKALSDTRAIKPEKYEELREEDFDAWLDLILNKTIEQINRQSNQLDVLKYLFEDLENQINDLSIRFDEFKKFMGYTLADSAISIHTGSDFCGNCTHCHRGKQADDAVCVCELSHEAIDPDDSSCAMFEPPF